MEWRCLSCIHHALRVMRPWAISPAKPCEVPGRRFIQSHLHKHLLSTGDLVLSFHDFHVNFTLRSERTAEITNDTVQIRTWPGTGGCQTCSRYTRQDVSPAGTKTIKRERAGDESDERRASVTNVKRYPTHYRVHAYHVSCPCAQ